MHMNTTLYLIISLIWLVAGIINIAHHAPWTSIAFDGVLFILFIVLGVRKAIKSGEDDYRKK